MTPHRIHPTPVTVRELLAEDTYQIPVYQRNYAWGEVEIRQLIDDLIDAAADPSISEYFLGNVVVSTAGTDGVFSVVDGQQRLATLHILFKFFSVEGLVAASDLGIRDLKFEARPRAEDEFERLGTADGDTTTEAGILAGYRIIEQYRPSRDLAEHLSFVLDQVRVVRLELPEQTDLNRYFEVMNTRGQQLEQQDIVKARMMARLSDDTARSTFAWVWDACADMDSYVQMAFSSSSRERLFGSDWAWLQVDSFDDLVAAHHDDVTAAAASRFEPRTLDQAVRAYSSLPDGTERPEGTGGFNSVVQFPVFLLHVLRVVQGDSVNESNASLDDKKLVKRFGAHIEESDDPETTVATFAWALLRCRVLFDAFVIKREFTTRTREGAWSLKRLVRSGKLATYLGTFPIERLAGEDGEPDTDLAATKRVRLLEGALRITYTSPASMHWITNLLAFAFAGRPEDLTYERVIGRLEHYARHKVAEALEEKSTLPGGLGFARIVFTYLDYLLAVEEGDLIFISRSVTRSSTSTRRVQTTSSSGITPSLVTKTTGIGLETLRWSPFGVTRSSRTCRQT